MDNAIENIPETDSIISPYCNDNLHIISLPSVIPVSYKCGLTAGALNLHQLQLMEDYHPIMGLWGNTM
eukprot:13298856-Ditylum_brightwellii.AAC.1